MSSIFVKMLVFLLIAMGAYMLTGKGGFLIAGFNTASKEKKEKYDEKKLCRFDGACMLISGIGLYFFMNGMDIGNAVMSILGYILLFAGIISIICFSDIYSRKDIQKPVRIGNLEKKEKILIPAKFILMIVFAVLLAVMNFSGGVEAKLISQNTLMIEANGKKTVSLNEIEDVKFIEHLKGAERKSGFGNFNMTTGRMKSDQIKEFKGYLNNSVQSAVVLTMKGEDSGYRKYIVFNTESEKATHHIYNELKEALK